MAGEEYTLTKADVEGCRKLLARLAEFDAQTGGYYVGNVQGHRQSATVTVHYNDAAGPVATAEAAAYAMDQVANLGLLCKKVIAHYGTNMVHGWGECAGCGWVHPLTEAGTVLSHPTEGGECAGSGAYPRREVAHG